MVYNLTMFENDVILTPNDPKCPQVTPTPNFDLSDLYLIISFNLSYLELWSVACVTRYHENKPNRKWALKPEVGIFETRDPAQAEGKLLRIILSYSTALCMVWVKPQFDSNLRQKHPIFGLWEFLENSRGTLEGKFINVFYSARRALSDPQDSLVTKILLVVENFSLSHSSYQMGSKIGLCHHQSPIL